MSSVLSMQLLFQGQGSKPSEELEKEIKHLRNDLLKVCVHSFSALVAQSLCNSRLMFKSQENM